MFGFVILDTRERRLFLARDFFGIKPLYYTVVREGFAFASEIKALLELPGVSRTVNPERLYFYLRYGLTDHGSETLFADVLQLPAAHYLEVSLDAPWQARPVRYWDVDLSQRSELPFEEAAERLRELFLENVRLHLRSDVPVGAAISGGIDSSAIVMAMRYLQGKHLELHTFSYIADDPAISEEQWVDFVGQASGATVHKIRPSAEEIVADLEHLIHVQDEPFGSTSIYAQYQVFRLARKAGIKVMLDGQGADELLGGYRYYMAARLASLLRQGRWVEAGRFLHRTSKWPGADSSWLLLRSVGFLMPPSLQAPARRLVGRDLEPPWLNANWFSERGVAPRDLSYTRGKEVLREYLYRTLSETSLPTLLRYEDRNSMAFSIESRVPFLTPEFANFALSLPEEYIIAPDGTSKAVFRRAMRGIVPDAVLDRRDKIGFATPEYNWLTTLLRPWVEGTLNSEAAALLPALNAKEMQLEWGGIVQGRKPFDWHVWRWLNLIQWARQFEVRFE
jgi:asparagine synthase (glutamine-hydrolysing)